MTTRLRDLFYQLNLDEERQTKGFSEDIRIASDAINFPYTNDPQRIDALSGWIQRHQRCAFGNIAAKRDGIHFCFVSEKDINTLDDDGVRAKIADSKRLWKQRAFRGLPKHSFILSVCSSRITYARADTQLRQFALYAQDLAGWRGRPDVKEAEVVDEWLYLRQPDGKIVKFVFSVDFFASAADRQWWHDHRIPAGIAFTANSLGHMVRYRELYGGESDQIEWALRTAMLTIDNAAKDVPHGPATWLMDKIAGRPFREFAWTEDTELPGGKKLGDKDCGSYAGYLHTDHAIRAEFFEQGQIPPRKHEPWSMDFTYIFDPASPDYVPFMVGHPASQEEVDRELQVASTWRAIGAAEADDSRAVASAKDPDQEERLRICRSWQLTEEEVMQISSLRRAT